MKLPVVLDTKVAVNLINHLKNLPDKDHSFLNKV